MSAILNRLLQSFEKNRDDPFLQYGIAIEYRNQGELDKALEFFRGVHEKFPSYVPNYYHFGQALEALGNREQAGRIYRDGIIAAESAGDAHAASELRQVLALL